MEWNQNQVVELLAVIANAVNELRIPLVLRSCYKILSNLSHRDLAHIFHQLRTQRLLDDGWFYALVVRHVTHHKFQNRAFRTRNRHFRR